MTENDKNTFSTTNKKYFTISLYILSIILIGSLIIKAIMDWQSVYSVILYIFNILSPFIMGFCFAFMLNPLVKAVCNKFFTKHFKFKKEKSAYYLSLMTTYVVLIGLIILLLIFVIPQIYYSLVDLKNVITEQYFIIMEKLTKSPNDFDNEQFDNFISIINNAVPQLVGYLSDFTTNLIPLIYNTSLSVITGLWNVILGIIISIYMLADRENILHHVKRLFYAVIPAEGSATIVRTGRESIDIFSRYVTGKTIDSLIIGVITFVTMTVFQLDFKILISVFVGVTNMIPYFGPFIGGIAGVMILLIKTPIDALIFGVLILIIQQFDGLYLGPKILGESTGLKPLWVIFAIMVGGSLFGVIGMLIGVPTVAVIAHILNIFINYRLEKRDLQYINGKVHAVIKKEKTNS